jgi:hypothetical protein
VTPPGGDRASRCGTGGNVPGASTPPSRRTGRASPVSTGARTWCWSAPTARGTPGRTSGRGGWRRGRPPPGWSSPPTCSGRPPGSEAGSRPGSSSPTWATPGPRPPTRTARSTACTRSPSTSRASGRPRWPWPPSWPGSRDAPPGTWSPSAAPMAPCWPHRGASGAALGRRGSTGRADRGAPCPTTAATGAGTAPGSSWVPSPRPSSDAGSGPSGPATCSRTTASGGTLPRSDARRTPRGSPRRWPSGSSSGPAGSGWRCWRRPTSRPPRSWTGTGGWTIPRCGPWASAWSSPTTSAGPR